MSNVHNYEERAKQIYKTVRNNSRVILYTDVMGRGDEDGNREQTLRDDLWAISTEELDELLALLQKVEIEAYEPLKDGCYSDGSGNEFVYMKEIDSRLATLRNQIGEK